MKSSFPETPLVIRTPRAHLSAILHKAPGHRLVILCHGFTGTKSESGRLFVQAARAFQKAGLNALRFDFMGSGDSSGEFNEMSPNSQIADALDVLAWGRRRYRKVAFLGLSFGGATVICAVQQAKVKPDAVLTWSAVPDLRWWQSLPAMVALRQKAATNNPLVPSKKFYRDLPKVDVPEAYQSLQIPRLQIQGSKDIPKFAERFASFCPKGDPKARQLILPEADHVFTNPVHRRKVIAESSRWLTKHLSNLSASK